MNRERHVAIGCDETVAALKDLEARFERGELACVALRVFKSDGTSEDIAVGGSDDEIAAALLALRKSDG